MIPERVSGSTGRMHTCSNLQVLKNNLAKKVLRDQLMNGIISPPQPSWYSRIVLEFILPYPGQGHNGSGPWIVHESTADSICTHTHAKTSFMWVTYYVVHPIFSVANCFRHWEENQKAGRTKTENLWKDAKLHADCNLRSGLNREPCSCEELANVSQEGNICCTLCVGGMPILSPVNHSMALVTSCTYVTKSMCTPGPHTYTS